MERATPLFSEEVALDQGTGMIGTATVADDEKVLEILRSMKSAVSHFVVLLRPGQCLASWLLVSRMRLHFLCFSTAMRF